MVSMSNIIIPRSRCGGHPLKPLDGDWRLFKVIDAGHGFAVRRIIPTALVVYLPHATVKPRHRWARPGHLHPMVADCDCIVRNLVRVADGGVKARVKPGHDVGGESRVQRRLVLLPAPKTLIPAAKS